MRCTGWQERPDVNLAIAADLDRDRAAAAGAVEGPGGFLGIEVSLLLGEPGIV